MSMLYDGSSDRQNMLRTRSEGKTDTHHEPIPVKQTPISGRPRLVSTRIGHEPRASQTCKHSPATHGSEIVRAGTRPGGYTPPSIAGKQPPHLGCLPGTQRGEKASGGEDGVVGQGLEIDVVRSNKKSQPAMLRSLA